MEIQSAIQKLTIDNPEYPTDRLTRWFDPLPDLTALGNLELLRMPLTALFCSRKCPGDAILKAYDLACELREKKTPVIGGFHTPVEKDMLDILLKGEGPIVICPARGLEGMRIPKSLQTGINQGRTLFISIVSSQEKRITSELSHLRNLLVTSLAAKYTFVHIAEGGCLEALSKWLVSNQLAK